VHDPSQPVRVEGLHQVLEGAPLDGVDRLPDGARGRDEDDGQRRVALLHPIEQLEAAHAIHDHIGENEVEVAGIDAADGGRRVGHELAGVPLARKDVLEDLSGVGVVVDDEHAGPHQTP
jgi:hypothetical protein